MTELCRPSPADPSRGEAEGVVKDAGADKEIAGKLELLKGGSGWACCEAGGGLFRATPCIQPPGYMAPGSSTTCASQRSPFCRHLLLCMPGRAHGAHGRQR